MLNAQEQRTLLENARVIAVVGHSNSPHRTSYQIAKTMRQYGYTIYPVNPTLQTIDGEPCYPSLADVPEPIDIVNVFRRSVFLEGVVEEAIAVGAKAVWAQLGVASPAAAARAKAANLPLVMNVCIKVAYQELMPRSR